MPETTTDGRLRVLTVTDGEGVQWAETALEPTGDYHTYETVRLALPEEVAGLNPVVVQVNGSGAVMYRIRRWRLVREP